MDAFSVLVFVGALVAWWLWVRRGVQAPDDDEVATGADGMEQVLVEIQALQGRVASAIKREDYAEAILVSERMLELTDEHLAADSELLLPLLSALSNFHRITGQPLKAMPYLKRSIPLRDKFPALHADQIEALGELAALHLQRGESREALPLIRREVELRRRHNPPDEALLRAQCKLLALTLEEPAMAEPLRQDITATARTLPQDAVVELANEANAEVGDALREGRVRDAWAAAENAVLLVTAAHGPEDDNAYVCRSNLAEMLRRNRRFAEAERQLLQLIAQEEQRLADGKGSSEGLRIACNNLALLYDECGRPDDAAKWRNRQMAILQSGGASVGARFNALNNLAVSQSNRGDDETAAQTYAEALALSPQGEGVDPRVWADTLNNHGVTLVNLKRLLEAGRIYQKVIEGRKAGLDIPMAAVASAFNGLGMVSDHLGKLAQAQDMFERALALKEKHLPADDKTLETGRHNLGSVYARLGDTARAAQVARLVLASREQRLGADHPDTHAARMNLETVLANNMVTAANTQLAVLATREEVDALMVKTTDGVLRRYATWDFGRARDESVSMVLVPEAQARNLQYKLARALPRGWRCFIGSTRWLGEEKHDGMAELVAIQADSQFDCLRVARTDAVNHDLDTEDIIRTLQDYDRRFGIYIYGAETDSVGFALRRLPEDLDAFAQELLDFCMDLETVGLIKEMITSSGNCVELWWD
ncbi:tetratricopeptide repeat protein [Uliginosibacterium sp. H1]|uniref:tetratricopeptide repeat protein n=1 Tax=Uliginosibacterium sp. H1 TaxID=3114757 RepID=UPI002E183C07|nr:tetratricopeptide repeat protein [Uliginosibacterium sp. H1]